MNNKWRNSVSAVLASVARPPIAVRPSSRVLDVASGILMRVLVRDTKLQCRALLNYNLDATHY